MADDGGFKIEVTGTINLQLRTTLGVDDIYELLMQDTDINELFAHELNDAMQHVDIDQIEDISLRVLGAP